LPDRGANVTADIFTARASRLWLSVFSLLGAAIALASRPSCSGGCTYGMLDQRLYEA
jgi:hypothetical protein